MIRLDNAHLKDSIFQRIFPLCVSSISYDVLSQKAIWENPLIFRERGMKHQSIFSLLQAISRKPFSVSFLREAFKNITDWQKNSIIDYVAPRIVVHCCLLLSIVVHCCPCCSLLSIIVNCYPLLFIVVHCCPMLSVAVHCFSLMSIVVHFCVHHRLPPDDDVIGTFAFLKVFCTIYNSFPMSCKGILWKQNSEGFNVDFVLTTPKCFCIYRLKCTKAI